MSTTRRTLSPRAGDDPHGSEALGRQVIETEAYGMIPKRDPESAAYYLQIVT
ncbi:MAG: hypothetical protein ACLUEQ_11520 [Cloacibacillus evryensis]